MLDISQDPQVCSCGNKGHRELRQWETERYKDVRDGVNDDLDTDEVERRVLEIIPAIRVNGGYCVRCQDFVDSWPGLSPQVREQSRGPFNRFHYHGLLELDAGNRNGCRLCTLFVQSIIRKNTLVTLYKLEQRFRCLGRSTEIIMSLSNYGENRAVTLEMPDRIRLTFRTWLFPTQAYLIPAETTLPKPRRLHAQLVLANKWLTNCCDTHKLCKAEQGGRMPTRLLAVSEDAVKLVDTAHWARPYRYATLSHCWGTIDFLKLTKQSLESFQINIPIENLTRTFRDAIALTRELKIGYIWIDSLCIIQDSEEDWQTESALMASVYGNSAISFAAAGAVDGKTGLFFHSETYVGKVHIEGIVEGELRAWDVAISLYLDSLLDSPLGKRSWALQERLLAPRTLHFTQDEMFWECQFLDARESFPGGLPSMEKRVPERKPLYDVWPDVVELYTQGSLTFSDDKLVAISGLARVAQAESNDQYLAGLWRKPLEKQLHWFVQEPPHLHAPFEGYRAPSWSWASVDGKIGHIRDLHSESTKCDLFAHVLGVWVLPLRGDSENTFGQIRGGSLAMGCTFILAGKLSSEMSEGNNKPYRRFSLEIQNSDCRCMSICLDSKEEEDGQILQLLPLTDETTSGVFSKNHINREPGWRRISGLLIRPTNAKKGEFRRVGVFSISRGFDVHGDHLDRMVKALDEHGASLAESLCAEVLAEPKFSGERYLITLI